MTCLFPTLKAVTVVNVNNHVSVTHGKVLTATGVN